MTKRVVRRDWSRTEVEEPKQHSKEITRVKPIFRAPKRTPGALGARALGHRRTKRSSKRPNNNAKALENWESEGGAAASNLGRAAEGLSVLHPDDQLQPEPLDPSNSTQCDRASQYSSSALLSFQWPLVCMEKPRQGTTRGFSGSFGGTSDGREARSPTNYVGPMVGDQS
jgi:hypothetical protein